MASVKIVLSEKEVSDIILNTVREKFRIPNKTDLELTWSDDSGAVVSTPETDLKEHGSWLDE